MKFDTLKTEIAQDDQAIAIPIESKTGDEYVAADGTPATITLLGTDSRAVQRAKDAQMRRMLRTRRQKLEPQDIRDNRVEIVVAAVTDWHGWEDTDGTPWPCTPANVATMLHAAPHILDQCEAAMNASRDFFLKSSTNS